MPTLLLPPRVNEDVGRVHSAAIRAGWEVVAAPSWRLPSDFVCQPPVAVYGDPLFADLAASALDLALLEPPDGWLPGLPLAFRKRSVTLTTLAEVGDIVAPTFIKPAADKSFSAAVYTDLTALLAVTADLPSDLPLLLSDQVIWEVEYRVFVLNGVPAAVSPYFRGGELVNSGTNGTWDAPPREQAGALAFATDVLADAGSSLPPGVVLDVGIIGGRGFAVVEANPAWASGLYGCNPGDVLTVIAASVCSRGGLSESLERFTRPAVTLEP